MSKLIHLFDYVDKTGDKPQIVRKYMNMEDRTYKLDKYDVCKSGLWIYQSAFNGQRVDGYVRLDKYVPSGYFADPNSYL